MSRLPLDLIDTTGRLRAADADQVSAIADSMREVGLLNPVTVWATKIIVNHVGVDGYGLIAGLHRIEAAKSLGWTEIDAHVLDLPDLKRQLAECDENLCGSKLSPSERAMFTRRRKEIYEALHPETRATSAGGEGRHKETRRQVGDDTADRFTLDTAKKTGQSERAIQRDDQRGKSIAPEILTQIAGTKLDTGRTLDALASVPKEAQQDKIDELKIARSARLLAEEEAKEVRKLNSATDVVVKDMRLEAVREWLISRLDVTERHQLGEMLAGLFDPLSRMLLREAA